MTHQQLVEEQLNAIRLLAEKFGVKLEPWVEQAIRGVALAAAKGAAEAGKVNGAIEQLIQGASYVAGRDRNEAISQSERQLEDYFKKFMT